MPKMNSLVYGKAKLQTCCVVIKQFQLDLKSNTNSGVTKNWLDRTNLFWIACNKLSSKMGLCGANP